MPNTVLRAWDASLDGGPSHPRASVASSGPWVLRRYLPNEVDAARHFRGRPSGGRNRGSRARNSPRQRYLAEGQRRDCSARDRWVLCLAWTGGKWGGGGEKGALGNAPPV